MPRLSLRRSLLYGLAALLAAILGLSIFFHLLGMGRHWIPVETATPDRGGEIDFACITEDGVWLLWTQSGQGRVGAADLGAGDRLHTFQSSSLLSVRPIAVNRNRLIVLRTSVDRGPFSSMLAGVERVFPALQISTVGDRTGFFARRRTTYLEGIDLHSGTPAFRWRGRTQPIDPGNPRPSGFEAGRAAISPDGETVAWWRAEEEILGVPVAATVTETIELIPIGERTGVSVVRSIESPGYFQTWSGILNDIGKPFWIDGDACFFLSFTNGGSLVPIDRRTGEFSAAFLLEDLQPLVASASPEAIGPPEAMTFLEGGEPEEGSFLFWTRDGGSLQFIRVSLDFEVEAGSLHHAGDLDFSSPLWLGEETLLLRERSSRKFISISAGEGRIVRFPEPPPASDDFQVIGRRFDGALVGLSDSRFWEAGPGSSEWSEIVWDR